MGSLAATPEMASNPDFAPMLPGFRSVPIDDPEALRAAVGESTAAVMIEPILGEAGVYPVPDETLVAAREACDEAGALLVLDEIQTGMGRTGSLWAYEQTPVRPDVMTTAKALGGGLPIGACVASPAARRRAAARRPRLDLRRRAADLHGGAGGARVGRRPRSCCSGCASCGAALREGLEAIDGVREVRGRGLMIGVGLEEGIDASEAGRGGAARRGWWSTFRSRERCACFRR